MKYQVKVAGELVSEYRTENVAVAEASKLDGAVVIAHETSGTYQSYTQVWPTTGETYTN